MIDDELAALRVGTAVAFILLGFSIFLPMPVMLSGPVLAALAGVRAAQVAVEGDR